MNADQLPPEALSDRWMNEHYSRIIKLIPNFRAYRASFAVKRAICALLAVHQQSRNASLDDRESAKFLAEVLPLFPGAMQSWRPDEAPALPEIPIDPVTKQPMRNPHLEPKDLASISALARDLPELNEHLKEVAKAGGSSYSRIKRLKEHEEARIALKDFVYDHSKNVLAHSANLTERNTFLAGLPEPIGQVMQEEAKQKVVIPWHRNPKTGRHNLTAMMAITKRSQDVRALVDKAAELERKWAERDLMQLRETDEHNRERRESAQALLATE